MPHQYRPPSPITQSEGRPSDLMDQSAQQKAPFAETRVPATDKDSDSEECAITASEIPGIRSYYTALIAAARSSLSPAEAQALVRRLRNEKLLAMRAAKDQRRMTRSRLQKRPLLAGPLLG